MQDVCDARKRFLNVTIEHPGSTSDYLAYISSKFANTIESEDFLAPGLCLFGDNAYANKETMAIPFRAIGSGPKDAYNYYHSQVRINIECAFGILVRRFGLLRRAMPSNLTINKIRALVQAMCKIHNFCIDNDDAEEPPPPTGTDLAHIIGDEGGIMQLGGVVGGGEHRLDYNHRVVDNKTTEPREKLLQIVTDSGLRRRIPKRWREIMSEHLTTNI